jgi:hypothetical protein
MNESDMHDLPWYRRDELQRADQLEREIDGGNHQQRARQIEGERYFHRLSAQTALAHQTRRR